MRTARFERKTNETHVAVELNLDGSGLVDVQTGLGFLDHMVHALGKHARFDLTVRCEGDLHVDDHHTVEDTAIGIGRALQEALGDGTGVRRFASNYAPLDEALARAVVDLSGRPWAEIHLATTGESVGEVRCENLAHFLRSLAIESRTTLHVDVLRGDNDHHRVEAGFKAVALALRAACEVEGDGIPSTKGVIG